MQTPMAGFGGPGGKSMTKGPGFEQGGVLTASRDWAYGHDGFGHIAGYDGKSIVLCGDRTFMNPVTGFTSLRPCYACGVVGHDSFECQGGRAAYEAGDCDARGFLKDALCT